MSIKGRNARRIKYGHIYICRLDLLKKGDIILIELGEAVIDIQPTKLNSAFDECGQI